MSCLYYHADKLYLQQNMTEYIFLKEEIKLENNTVQLMKNSGSRKSIDRTFRKRKSISQNSNSKNAHLSTKNTQYDTAQVEPIRERSALRSNDKVSHPIKRKSVNYAGKKRSHISDSNQPLITRTVMTNYKIDEKEELSQRVVTQPIAQTRNITLSNKQNVATKNDNLKIYDKHLQIWINSIIQEHCIDEKFDKKIPLSALKKYGIDKNTLLAKGFNNDNVNRIYNSLYIYSQGFSNMIKEIGSRNSMIYRVIWHVYSILLQYFSNGEFKALVAQLQREKDKKLEEIATKLQAKQQIIEKNQETNQQRHFQVLKELKILKKENYDLIIDNTVLTEDCNNSDLAFKDEVSLRMMFQNKISEVHSLYSEMGIKHKLLFDDFNMKLQEVKVMKDKISQLNEYNLSLNKQNVILKQDIKLLKQSVIVLKRQKENLQQICKQKSDSELQMMIKQQYHIKKIREIQLTLNEKQYQLSNAELVIELHIQTGLELKKEYSQMLFENKQLQKIIAKQQESINSFIEERKLDRSNIKLQSQLKKIKKDLNLKEQVCNIMKGEIEMLNSKLQQKQHQNELISYQNQSLAQSFKVNNQKIEEMKGINTSIEIKLMQLKQKQQNIDVSSVIIQSNKNGYENQINILTANVSNLMNLKETLQSNISILTLKLQYQEQFKKTQLTKVQQQYRITEIEAKFDKQQCEKYTEERNKIRIAYDSLWTKYKNEQFQRNNLELRYKHSLTVLQSDNDNTKELNRTISTLKVELQQKSLRCKILENALSSKQKQYSSQMNQLNLKIKQQKQEIIRKMSYVHPMVYEDSVAAFCRSESSMLQQEDEFIQQKKIFHEKYYQMEQNFKQAKQEIITVRQFFTKQIYKKQMQNEYQKKKNRELSVAIDNLQLNIQVYKTTEKQQRAYTLSHEQQKRYLQVIKQKTQQIDQLLKQVQTIHDKNQQLIIRVQQTQKQLKKQEQRVEQIQREQNTSIHNRTAHFIEKSALSWMSKEQQERISLRLRQSQISLEEMASMIEQSILRGSIRKSSHPRQMSPIKRDIRQSEFWITDQIHVSERGINEKKQVKIQKNGFQKPGWRKDLGNKIKNANNFYRK